MICKKCGKETDDGNFCQFCGSSLVPVEDVNTENGNTENGNAEANVEASKLSEEEFNSEPYDLTKVVNDSSNDSPLSFGIETNKKKKKWPKITGIVAAVLVVLGIGTYFAYPMIVQIVNPKGYAVAALEKTTSTMQTKLTGYMDNVDLTKSTQSSEVSMKLHLDNLDIAGESVFSEFSGKDIVLKMQSSPSDEIASGSISLANGSSTSISIEFYIDGTTIKFKVPKLSSKTFSIDASSLSSTGSSYSSSRSQVFNMLGGFGNASQMQSFMDTYSKPVKAAIQDVIKGLNTIIENCKYDKTGSETLQTDNGNISVTVYEATLTEEAIKKGAVAIINNVYSDKELSSYTSLINLFIGKTKQDLISSVESANLDMNDIPITLYINKNQEVVKYLFDFNKMIVSNDAKVSFSFIGKENIYSYMVVDMDIPDQLTAKIIGKNEADGFLYSMNLSVIDNLSPVNIEYGVQGKSTKSGDNEEYTFDKIYMKGSIDNEKIDVSMSGNATSKPISSVTNNSSSFSGALNLESMTNEQKKSVLTEIYNNSSSLKGILPDTIITTIKTEIYYIIATLK